MIWPGLCVHSIVTQNLVAKFHEVFMNENDQSTPPEIPAIDPSVDEFLWPTAEPTPSKPLSWWLRKLFACNPFYLVSAALLLYSCHLISIDAPFLSGESARLLFNFSSVQFYELMLVGTALFLARRAIWYDSTLLVDTGKPAGFCAFHPHQPGRLY